MGLLQALVRLISHTSRRRKLSRNLGGLYPHQVILSPCAEQPCGGHCLSGQLHGVVGALKDALLAVSLQSSTDQFLSLRKPFEV